MGEGESVGGVTKQDIPSEYFRVLRLVSLQSGPCIHLKIDLTLRKRGSQFHLHKRGF
jgi:hypothetical protein